MRNKQGSYYGLAMPDWLLVLASVAEHGESTVPGLASRCGAARGVMQTALDQLACCGLVIRDGDSYFSPLAARQGFIRSLANTLGVDLGPPPLAEVLPHPQTAKYMAVHCLTCGAPLDDHPADCPRHQYVGGNS